MATNNVSANNPRPYCEDCAFYRPADYPDAKKRADFAICAKHTALKENVLAVARVLAEPPSPAVETMYCTGARIFPCGLEGKDFVPTEVLS